MVAREGCIKERMLKMKKLISILLSMLVMFSLVVPVSAEYVPQFEYEAQMLYDLGLFKGTDNGFELDKKCDRLQAAALFIRLLGKETEAINNPKTHPFKDVPEWASPYVGQMYHDGYTKGISENEYGTGDTTANQFATFCLRALGYLEVGYNKPGTLYYSYEQALEKMLERFIIRKESFDIIEQRDVFLRDYAVKMAYNSLFDNLYNVYTTESKFLIRVLGENGAIDEELLKNRDWFVEDDIRYFYSPESFIPYFEKMIKEAAEDNKIVTVVNKREMSMAGKINSTYLPSRLTQELLYLTAGGGIVQHRNVMADDLATDWQSGVQLFTRTTINPHGSGGGMTYRCIRYMTHGDIELTDKEKKVIEKSKEFLSTITDDMSDYDKFKAAYDFIGKNVEHNVKETKSGDIDVLVDGKAVCQGFSTAYLYLCRLMGLECWSVGGDYGELKIHAWNKVKLNGKYYNVDPAGNGNLKYFLFKNPEVHNLFELDKIFDFPCTEDYRH